jgi:hypothetical protein
MVNGNKLLIDFSDVLNNSNATNSTSLTFNIEIFNTEEEVTINNANKNTKGGNTNNNNNNVYFSSASLLAANKTGLVPPITNNNQGSGGSKAGLNGNLNNNNNNVILGVLMNNSTSNSTTNSTAFTVNNNNNNDYNDEEDDSSDDFYNYDIYNYYGGQPMPLNNPMYGGAGGQIPFNPMNIPNVQFNPMGRNGGKMGRNGGQVQQIPTNPFAGLFGAGGQLNKPRFNLKALNNPANPGAPGSAGAIQNPNDDFFYPDGSPFGRGVKLIRPGFNLGLKTKDQPSISLNRPSNFEGVLKPINPFAIFAGPRLKSDGVNLKQNRLLSKKAK